MLGERAINKRFTSGDHVVDVLTHILVIFLDEYFLVFIFYENLLASTYGIYYVSGSSWRVSNVVVTEKIAHMISSEKSFVMYALLT